MPGSLWEIVADGIADGIKNIVRASPVFDAELYYMIKYCKSYHWQGNIDTGVLRW